MLDALRPKSLQRLWPCYLLSATSVAASVVDEKEDLHLTARKHLDGIRIPAKWHMDLLAADFVEKSCA